MAINKVCGTVLLKAINMVCGTVLLLASDRHSGRTKGPPQSVDETGTVRPPAAHSPTVVELESAALRRLGSAPVEAEARRAELRPAPARPGALPRGGPGRAGRARRRTARADARPREPVGPGPAGLVEGARARLRRCPPDLSARDRARSAARLGLVPDGARRARARVRAARAGLRRRAPDRRANAAIWPSPWASSTTAAASALDPRPDLRRRHPALGDDAGRDDARSSSRAGRPGRAPGPRACRA